jgi:PAS domain S-box-containing protein
MKTKTKVLITEDEMVVALDLERRLCKLGFECLCVPSGEQAVEQAAKMEPDIVLMDICLQGTLDGVEAAARIRINHDIPIVYLTANADESTLQRAQLTHPASYLLKPFKERELQICIEMALVNHALQRELKNVRDELETRVIERTADLIRANASLRQEIRNREESETQVREQAALLDKARDAIFVRNVEGIILYWNKSAERLYGFQKSEAISQRTSDVLQEEPYATTNALGTTLEHGAWTGELVHRNRAGNEFIVESRWTLVRENNTLLIVNTDISERKKIETQFLRAQRLESVGALASGIAHDLNNVFTPLLMTAQLLGEDTKDPKITELADIILASARRGSDMVKQVLLFVRGGEGERQPFRVEHLVKELISLLRDTFPKTIRFHSSFTLELWSVVGDATRLHQVLMNLCVNARDAMPDGGVLSIALKNFTVDQAYASLHGHAQPGDYVCLSISDTGTGMDAEVKQKIFDPFFTTKEPGKGTGLGLPTVQAIIREHGGFLNLDTAPGAGTSFHVFLPGCNDAGTKVDPILPQIPRGNGQLILIADDEQMVREIIKTALEAYDYRVITADDGIDALAKFAANQKELAGIIVDLQMPNLDGSACVQALRQINGCIPILSISGSLGTEAPPPGPEQNVAFLAKPFTKGALLAAVQQLVETRVPAQKTGIHTTTS